MSDERPEPTENEPEELDDIEAEAERIMGQARRPADLPEVPEWDYERPGYTRKHLETSDMSSWRAGGVGLSAAYAMIGAVVVGFGVGWLLDGGGESVTWRAVLTIFGAVMGLVSAVWMVIREQARNEK